MTKPNGDTISDVPMKVQDMVLLHNHLVTYLKKAMPQARDFAKEYPREKDTPDDIKEFLYTVSSLSDTLKNIAGVLNDEYGL